MILKTIKEEEANHALFKFLFTCIQFLDIIATSISNFHLVFLINLSRYLGFYPEDNYSELNFLFDLNGGKFSTGIANHLQSDRNISNIIHNLLNINFNNMEDIKLSHNQRVDVLKIVISYFNLHLGGIGEIKSLQVLESVFGD